MAKLGVKFQLTKEEVEYVEQYKASHHLGSRSMALEYILDEHQHKNDVEVTQYLAERLAESLGALLLPELKKLRMGMNHADKNTGLNLLLLNTLLSYSGMKSLTRQDTPQLMEAREELQKRLAKRATASGWRNT